MEINAATKIDELLEEYPFLEDFLVKLSPKFKGLKNPIMRKTIGKVATLSKVAGIGGLDLNKPANGQRCNTGRIHSRRSRGRYQ